MQRWYIWLVMTTSLASYSCFDKALCYGFLVFCNPMSNNNKFNKNELSLNPRNTWKERGQGVLPAVDLQDMKPK